MAYSVVLEQGRDGGFAAWVIELPGCFARAPTREEVEAKLPAAIREFLEWRLSHGDIVRADDLEFEVVTSTLTEVDAARGDTSILLDADRAPLHPMGWRKIESWIEGSRQDLLRFVRTLHNVPLDFKPDGAPRSLQESIFHIAMVEIMYAVWTFNLHSTKGLEEFLAWTRRVASSRMQELAERSEDQVTVADWAGAPEPEQWTPRKAARRLLWHERLHLRSLKRRFGDRPNPETGQE